MSDSGQKLAALTCRGVLGTSLLLHGLQKFGMLGGIGIRRFADYLDGLGVVMPTAAAWVVASGEVLCGAALFVGCFHRVAAGFAIVVMTAAIWLVHGSTYFLPRGLEYQLALIAVAISVYAFGPGPFAYKVELKQNRK